MTSETGAMYLLENLFKLSVIILLAIQTRCFILIVTLTKQMKKLGKTIVIQSLIDKSESLTSLSYSKRYNYLMCVNFSTWFTPLLSNISSSVFAASQKLQIFFNR